jgi:hypothetical protein
MGDSDEISRAPMKQAGPVLQGLRSFPPVGQAWSPSPAYQARLSLLNSAVVFPPTPARATLYDITVLNLTYKVIYLTTLWLLKTVLCFRAPPAAHVRVEISKSGASSFAWSPM